MFLFCVRQQHWELEKCSVLSLEHLNCSRNDYLSIYFSIVVLFVCLIKNLIFSYLTELSSTSRIFGSNFRADLTLLFSSESPKKINKTLNRLRSSHKRASLPFRILQFILTPVNGQIILENRCVLWRDGLALKCKYFSLLLPFHCFSSNFLQ